MLVLVSCNPAPGRDVRSWTRYLDKVGTYSSARMVDLDHDGVMDIVIGAGGKEELHCDTSVIALDGATGRIRWAIPGENQYVGSAVFMDIDNDQVADVIIGGRWAQLSAISGATGKRIWTFFPERTRPDGNDGGWYNFTTPQFVPDQDGDHLSDLLIANGGDARAAPGDVHRPVGRLLVLSSRTGKVLGMALVPDGKETYMSVVCEWRAAGHAWADRAVPGTDSVLSVLFGTGGETIGGHLYRTSVAAIMKGDVGGAKVLATGGTKGFVASPVLVDINRDGIRDLVVNAVDGRMLAIDGATDTLLWQLNFPGTEAYTIPAIGYFTGDSIPDFFCNYAIGVFPRLTHSVRFMVDGSTGKIGYQDTIPSFQYASPVAADLNGDGYDEVIVNQSAMKRLQFRNQYYSYLLAFDFKNKRNYSLGDTLPATNLAGTPWIGDLDGDSHYDIVSTAVKYEDALFDLQQPLGLFIARYSTDKLIKKPVTWGAYMGSRYTGLFY